MSGTALRTELRRGAYLDSVVLLRLQRGLADRDGVRSAGALMGTPANRDLLRESGLWDDALGDARPDDLILAVRADSEAGATAALAAVDEILVAEAPAVGSTEVRYRSLATALQENPAAPWVLVSVAGRWAAPVVEEALAAGRHVFLYSDNVPLAEEARLKELAGQRGLLLLGPDCGTARIAGIGLGFANRVRSGGIGLVAASGTGLQSLMVEIHRQGGGISQAIGVGGRDLAPEVEGRSTLAALRLLARDPETRAIVLVSKPPSPRVGARVLAEACTLGKPVIVCFQGLAVPVPRLGNLRWASGLEEAARIVARLSPEDPPPTRPSPVAPGSERRRWIRGLFAGGTLAQELQLALRPIVDPLWSNAPVVGVSRLEDPRRSREHSIVDLGADELTVGRPHPMIDPLLRAERLRAELADPETAAVVVDLVLGDGSHPDPTAAILEALAEAPDPPPVLAWVVGTELDPQDLRTQVDRLRQAGVSVHRGLAGLIGELIDRTAGTAVRTSREVVGPEIDLAALAPPFVAINVGLEDFATAIEGQLREDQAVGADGGGSGEGTGPGSREDGSESLGSESQSGKQGLGKQGDGARGSEARGSGGSAGPAGRVVRVDWRPPAGGDEKLAGILARMKGRTG